MQVNICGILHDIVEMNDNFNVDTHFVQIDYNKAEILVNQDMAGALKKETIFHVIVHSILVHLGYNEQANDEQFVQAMANAICQWLHCLRKDAYIFRNVSQCYRNLLQYHLLLQSECLHLLNIKLIYMTY